MKHSTFDCYGVNKYLLDDVKLINELLPSLAFRLGLKPIAPTTLIPYYYGKIKEDIGISAHILLSCGHITIHTFPLRMCYFLDVFSINDFDENILKDFLMLSLPFDSTLSIFNTSLRKENTFQMLPYDKENDFGPHLMMQINSNEVFDMEKIYNFLEHLAYDINMEPITRAFVLKDKIDNEKYLSGIIVIAESHISFHYEINSQKIYFDVFSCKPFDYNNVSELLSKIGEVKSNVLIPRGSKHYSKINENSHEHEAFSMWQNAIH